MLNCFFLFVDFFDFDVVFGCVCLIGFLELFSCIVMFDLEVSDIEGSFFFFLEGCFDFFVILVIEDLFK